jgi:hypothetical protein
MPKIIIQTDLPPDRSAVTLSERVVAANLESPHYTTQLIERLAWATADAEAIERATGTSGADDVRPRDAHAGRRRSHGRAPARARPVASALALLIVALLSIPSVALAHSHRHDGRTAGGVGQQTAAAAGLQWYDITDQTVSAAAYPEPVTQSRTWSVSWLAAARAIGHHRDPSYTVAAFAQALHDTLVAQVPSRQLQLDSDLAQTLAELPDGRAKSAGIAAGAQQAHRVLLERQGDGLDTASLDVPFTPPPAGPGVWQPTPPTFAPAVRAGQGDARAFLLAANDQFDPGPPPGLNSRAYRTGLAEVRAYGSATSAVRTSRQTDTALFWEPAINIQFVQVLRAVLADTSHSLGWQARFVAAFNVITTDAQIAIYNAKFKYVFWRPVTAIQTGAIDPDPSWTPLFTTPRYPDWPSGHGGVVGAAQAILDAYLGPKTPAPIAVTSPTDPGSTHTYTRWTQITQEVIDARVWEGIHFRFSDVAGDRLGTQVARYDLRRLRSIGL